MVFKRVVSGRVGLGRVPNVRVKTGYRVASVLFVVPNGVGGSSSGWVKRVRGSSSGRVKRGRVGIESGINRFVFVSGLFRIGSIWVGY